MYKDRRLQTLVLHPRHYSNSNQHPINCAREVSSRACVCVYDVMLSDSCTCKMSTKNVLDDDNGSDVDDVMFIRESSEIGVEFGRLLLGGCESEGPGDGRQESERCTDDTSSDRRSASAV